jgi:hypothetical protein
VTPSHKEDEYHAISALLIQFDFVRKLKSLGVSSGDQITDVTLHLYYGDNHSSGKTKNSAFEIRRILMAWNEGRTPKFKMIADRGAVCGKFTKHGVQLWNGLNATARTKGVEGNSGDDYNAKNDVSYSVEGNGSVTYNDFGWCKIGGRGMLDAVRFWFDHPHLNYG